MLGLVKFVTKMITKAYPALYLSGTPSQVTGTSPQLSTPREPYIYLKHYTPLIILQSVPKLPGLNIEQQGV